LEKIQELKNVVFTQDNVKEKNAKKPKNVLFEKQSVLELIQDVNGKKLENTQKEKNVVIGIKDVLTKNANLHLINVNLLEKSFQEN